MERKFSKKYRLLRTLTIIAVCFFCGVVCSCTSNAIPAGTPFPLTYENFQKVLNSEILFDSMYIQYKYSHLESASDEIDSPESAKELILSLNAIRGVPSKERAKSVSLGQFETFDTRIVKRNGHSEYEVDVATTTIDKVNLIFEYVNKHSDYFFSGEEFEDPESHIYSPIYCGTYLIYDERDYYDHTKHNFILSVRDPIDFKETRKWMLLKSADEPNEALKGLIELLEKEFFAVDLVENAKVSE